jgi:hypothetical protein
LIPGPVVTLFRDEWKLIALSSRVEEQQKVRAGGQ